MSIQFTNYVCVFFKDGYKFVTEIESHNTANWESGKPAKSFSESFAKDIVHGLTLNGYAAAVVKVLKGMEFYND